MTYSGDNYPGHPNADAQHILAVWEAPEDVFRTWFSGELPTPVDTYALRADRVYDLPDGRKGVEMRFVRI